MDSKIPLTVAVVGALLIGGAITGTTRASWSEQISVSGTSVGSGTMAISASATPTTVTLNRGESTPVTLTLTDGSTPEAKNLTQTLDATVSSTSPSNVTAALVATSGACSGVALPQNTTPGQQRVTCVAIGATADAAAGTYTVTVTPSGDQVSGGWTSQAPDIAITVTVNAPAALTCLPQTTKDFRSFSWSAVSGATGYDVSVSTTQNGTYGSVATYGSAVTQHQVNFEARLVRFFRVTATTGSGNSAISGAIRMERANNNGNSNMLCTVETP